MAKLVCPLCGSATAPNPVTFEATVTIGDSSSGMYFANKGMATAVTPQAPGRPAYGIMQCPECNSWFVAKCDVGRDWLSVYPITHGKVAKEIPEPIRSEFEEAHLCFAVGAYRACLAMCEAVLEGVWRDQGAKRLSDLRDKGTISQKLYDQADEVRLWANVVKHELVDQPVSREDAEELLGYLEAVLDAVYVQPASLAALRQKRKQLGKDTKS